jgi:predicted short-subunit dehydrogenase-like oxidoreductase (DUF2520 family)
VVDRAELIFLTVPDDVIEEVCSQLIWTDDKAAVHCSGAHTIDVLATAAGSRAQVGACHPMQAFAGSGDVASHLTGCMFGVEADEPLWLTLAELVHAIGGWSLHLRSEDKVSYHLAGVLASNFFVALTSTAASLLENLGLERDQALRGLLPILGGTVRNLESRGLPMALTGPISRGDVGTIELHLRTLAARHPELVSLYVELGLRTIPIARERGGLTAEAETSLESLLQTYMDNRPS